MVKFRRDKDDVETVLRDTRETIGRLEVLLVDLRSNITSLNAEIEHKRGE